MTAVATILHKLSLTLVQDHAGDCVQSLVWLIQDVIDRRGWTKTDAGRHLIDSLVSALFQLTSRQYTVRLTIVSVLIELISSCADNKLRIRDTYLHKIWRLLFSVGVYELQGMVFECIYRILPKDQQERTHLLRNVMADATNVSLTIRPVVLDTMAQINPDNFVQSTRTLLNFINHTNIGEDDTSFPIAIQITSLIYTEQRSPLTTARHMLTSQQIVWLDVNIHSVSIVCKMSPSSTTTAISTDQDKTSDEERYLDIPFTDIKQIQTHKTTGTFELHAVITRPLLGVKESTPVNISLSATLLPIQTTDSVKHSSNDMTVDRLVDVIQSRMTPSCPTNKVTIRKWRLEEPVHRHNKTDSRATFLSPSKRAGSFIQPPKSSLTRQQQKEQKPVHENTPIQLTSPPEIDSPFNNDKDYTITPQRERDHLLITSRTSTPLHLITPHETVIKPEAPLRVSSIAITRPIEEVQREIERRSSLSSVTSSHNHSDHDDSINPFSESYEECAPMEITAPNSNYRLPVDRIPLKSVTYDKCVTTSTNVRSHNATIVLPSVPVVSSPRISTITTAMESSTTVPINKSDISSTATINRSTDIDSYMHDIMDGQTPMRDTLLNHLSLPDDCSSSSVDEEDELRRYLLSARSHKRILPLDDESDEISVNGESNNILVYPNVTHSSAIHQLSKRHKNWHQNKHRSHRPINNNISISIPLVSNNISDPAIAKCFADLGEIVVQQIQQSEITAESMCLQQCIKMNRTASVCADAVLKSLLQPFIQFSRRQRTGMTMMTS